MATVRAVTMQRRRRRSGPILGRPLAARNAASSAKGRAKRVWESLMSFARRRQTRRHEDTKAPVVGAGEAGGEAGSVMELIVFAADCFPDFFAMDGNFFWRLYA